MNKEIFVAYTIESIGIYAYPEFISLFTSFFNNTATKEQLDEIGKHIKALRCAKKLAKAYDEYQLLYGMEQKK